MQNIICNLLSFGLFFAAFVHGRSLIDKKKELIIEPVVGPFKHSEGPHWDHHTQKLYFVDIVAQKICRFSPISKHVACIYIDKGPVGVAVPVEGEPDKLVAGVATKFVLVNWDGQKNYIKSPLETLAVVDTDRNGTRWNDGKVDSSGRFWGGTIGPEVNDVVVPEQAAFYRIDSELKPKKELTVTNSNGLAWNLQDDTLYYIDTPTRQVAAFDFEPISGTISNKSIVFDLQKHNISGLPDGMTIDTNGNLWIALYNGGGVINVDPRNGKVIRFVKLPVSKVTSAMFGGPNLDVLYVTTSSRGLNLEEKIKQPYAGYVFAVHGLGVHGFTANSFKLWKMSQVTVKPLAGPYELGEGPHWEHVSQKLYFVDIFAQKIYRFDPVTQTITSAFLENGPVSFVIPVAGTTNKFLSSTGTDIVLLSWDGEKNLTKCATQTLCTADSSRTETRWNDGKTDAAGRFWGGTMGFAKDGVFPANVGSLYVMNNNLALKKEVTPVTISNGLAWSSNNDTMYYIDSPTRQVVAYDYNFQTGAISNKRVVFDLQKNNISGIPDGMTIDTDGNLWVALFGGGGVIQINPKTSELLRFIKINGAKNITSVAFGGPEFDTLYVTSATIELKENELKEQPYAGYLFSITGLGVRGSPASSFKLPHKLT
ncbi:uncharacterized protein LOC117606630 [Osmia lignaria lignaria]|uniref:uncharacterized protein LOC117606630 n=1 Tax=Osmia lignaria lignaria TaxID=1437193 RepID=UPI00402B41E5